VKKVKCPKCKKIIGIDVDDYWSSYALGIMVIVSFTAGFILRHIFVL